MEYGDFLAGQTGRKKYNAHVFFFSSRALALRHISECNRIAHETHWEQKN